MTRVKIYHLDRDTDSYEHVATAYDSGTVDGTGPIAERIREVFNDLQDAGHSVSNYWSEIQHILDKRYNNGYFRATVVN